MEEGTLMRLIILWEKHKILHENEIQKSLLLWRNQNTQRNEVLINNLSPHGNCRIFIEIIEVASIIKQRAILHNNAKRRAVFVLKIMESSEKYAILLKH